MYPIIFCPPVQVIFTFNDFDRLYTQVSNSGDARQLSRERSLLRLCLKPPPLKTCGKVLLHWLMTPWLRTITHKLGRYDGYRRIATRLLGKKHPYNYKRAGAPSGSLIFGKQ